MLSPLRSTSARRETGVMAAVALVLVLLYPFLELVAGYGELADKILIWAIFALGFDLLVGFTGFLSFGHAAFWGGGAYIAGLYLLHVSDDVLGAMLIGTGAAAVLALVMGWLTLRRHGIYFAILTLAFSQMFYFLALAPLQDYTGGDNGLTAIPKPTLFGVDLEGQGMYAFLAVITFLAVYAARRIARSPYGLILRAIKSNETRLAFTGIDVGRYKLMAFVISGIYGGLSGTLLAIYERYVPLESLHWATSGEVVMMSVIGGLGTLFGPMIGAGVVLYLENVLSAQLAQWLLLLGLIFMAFVIFLPGGIVEGVQKLVRLVRKGGSHGSA